MKISNILKTKDITVSCEIFPPKLHSDLDQSRKIVSDIAALKPDFISVTYGAAGTTASFTAELADCVEKNNIPALAHVTCVSSDDKSLSNYLESLKSYNIENVLALRGDIPTGYEPKRVYSHASDLRVKVISASVVLVIQKDILNRLQFLMTLKT